MGTLSSTCISSPDDLMKSREVSRSMTKRAPVPFFPIRLHADTSASTSRASDIPSCLMKRKSLAKRRLSAKFVEPMTSKNLRISCWNTMIRAISPTCINPPTILLVMRISSSSVSFQKAQMITIPIKMLMATVPRTRR